MRWRGYHYEPEDRPSDAELAADYRADLADAEWREQSDPERIANLFQEEVEWTST